MSNTSAEAPAGPHRGARGSLDWKCKIAKFHTMYKMCLSLYNRKLSLNK